MLMTRFEHASKIPKMFWRYWSVEDNFCATTLHVLAEEAISGISGLIKHWRFERTIL